MQWKTVLPPWIWFHSLAILNVHFFHPFFLSQIISSLTDFDSRKFCSAGTGPLEKIHQFSPRFLVLYFLMAAHSNPLINFPEDRLSFKLPSFLMNSISNLPNVPSDYSMLYHVLLKKNIRSTIFMFAFLAISDLYCVFLLRQQLHIVISKYFTTSGSESEKRRTRIKMLSVALWGRRAG